MSSINGEDLSEETIELRSRSSRNFSSSSNSRNNRSLDDIKSSLSSKVLIEKKVKGDDTINKISLQYSVPVSEIKRANNIITDQDLYALSFIKIPVNRLRKELNFDQDRHLFITESENSTNVDCDDFDDRRPLINKKSLNTRSVEELFENTDASLAQIRDGNSVDTLTNGQFHFIDARPPQSHINGVWLIVCGLILIFVVVPIVLTLLEEKSEVSEERSKVTPSADIQSN
ncbi:unnamed protein product [Dracunculus medinensis]|uniref:LysM domain-containing protein n=1 Tax=Dracunculus medinensis TaxID=318479 RepID=A0A0N4UFB3_DRAME|nr:unnamed protein product [Dracunculus medinensis]